MKTSKPTASQQPQRIEKRKIEEEQPPEPEDEWDSDAEKDAMELSTSATTSSSSSSNVFSTEDRGLEKYDESTIKVALEKAQQLVHTSGFFVRRGLYTRKQATTTAKNFFVNHGIPRKLAWRMPVFAEDLPPRPGNTGAKSFIVTSYDTFWDHYANQLSDTKRYHYEVILKRKPCNLYVDLEFEYEFNPHMLGKAPALELRFRKFLLEQLVAEGAAGSEDEIGVTVLESSNDAKFSVHYVIHIYGRAFANNYHCGAFMRRLCNTALVKFGPEESNPFFILVSKKLQHGGEETVVHNFLADLGVYTMYRMFRMAWSSKRKEGAKPRPLIPTEVDGINDMEDANGSATGMRKEVFMRTLVQHVYPSDDLILMKEPNGNEPKSSNDLHRFRVDKQKLNASAQAAADLLGSRATIASLPSVRYDSLLGRNAHNMDMSTHKLGEADVKDFIEPLCNCIRGEWGDPSMNFSVKNYSNDRNTITLWSSSLDCRLKGSPHKSNHVSFEVNVARYTWSQLCFDQDFPCNQKWASKQALEKLPAEIRQRIERERKGYKIKDAKLKEKLDIFLRTRNDGLTPDERMTLAMELSRMSGFYVNVPLAERNASLSSL